MLEEKYKNIKSINIVLILLFTFFFFLFRLPRLHNDIINPDAVNWHFRSEQFVNGLKYFQFEKTYQHYHPGVTLMWVTGIPIEIYKQLTGDTVYNHLNFETFDFIAKTSLVIIQFILTILCIFILARAFGFKGALIIVSIFSFDPFFLGNSRLYHLDALFSLFVFLSLLAAFEGFSKNKSFYTFLGGFLGGLAFLTKSIGVGLLVYVSGVLLWLILRNKLSFKHLAVYIGAYILGVFLLFPALWVNPIHYITEIFTESERIGLRRGHEQIIFGETVIEAGITFYPLVLALKFSPFILFGTLLGIFSVKYSYLKKKLKDLSPNLKLIIFSSIFYLGYFVVMSLSSKKIDRYMVPVFPMFALLAYVGYKELYAITASKFRFFSNLALILVFSVFVAVPLFTQFPFYFTYSSPFFGSAEDANKIVAQKSFGVGIHDLRNLIIKKYGPEATLGFIDTKPIKAIYPNSQIYDIRINGASDYDIIVLGINEEFPENVTKTDVVFTHDDSVYINGLEYWRVYVKQK